MPTNSFTGTQPSPFYLYMSYGCPSTAKGELSTYDRDEYVLQRSQTQRVIYCMSPFIWLSGRGTAKDPEKGSEVAKGKGYGKLDYKGQLERRFLIVPLVQLSTPVDLYTPNGVNYIIKGKKKSVWFQTR